MWVFEQRIEDGSEQDGSRVASGCDVGGCPGLGGPRWRDQIISLDFHEAGKRVAFSVTCLEENLLGRSETCFLPPRPSESDDRIQFCNTQVLKDGFFCPNIVKPWHL